jgi:surface protein
MNNIFEDCTSLEYIDLSSFDTSNVQNFQYSFCNCTSLTSLKLSNFKTSNAFSFKYMFYSCSSLTSLNLPYFDTSQVYDEELIYVFDGCNKLTLTINTQDCQNLIETLPPYVKVLSLKK